jgi:glycolate oxidase subunit GlcD
VRRLRALTRALRRVVGRANVCTAPADLALYAYDSSLARHAPEIVVFPASTQEVAAIVAAANRYDTPFTPRGAGTNLSGGSVPIRGGIVIALSRLNRLLGVDEANRCARVQPGMTNLALQNALAPRGWLFHPDPASQSASTLGGNVAENAGGPHCLKHGVTTNHILGVRAVLPDGEVMDFGGAAPDAPGYDLTGLTTGSEGTLGVVTEITVRISRLPETLRTLLAVFDSMDEASEAVSAIIAAGIIPAALEMIDRVMIAAIQASMDAGYPEDAEAVLIVEVDGLREAVGNEARRCAELCRARGAREVRLASSESERERLWAGRRGAFGAAARLSPEYIVNDGVVPRTRLPGVLRKTQEIAQRYGVRVGNNFHAGDGNLHPLILLSGQDPSERERAQRAAVEMTEACVAAGGSITGEHGIGLEKRWAMPRFLSPAELGAHAAVKRCFDPRGLCNPGKVLPDELPPSSRAAVAREPEGVVDRSAPAPEIDGNMPKGVLTPRTEAEAAGLLQGAAAEGAAIIPFGGATKLDLGMPPARYDYALSLGALVGVVEHDAENLTATVRAGTRLADFQAALAQRGQWLPIDPPLDEATIGGVIAANACGPARLRYGGCRDLVLGLRVALPSGEVISAGGKTVKNVTGYDLPKLFVGSLGTLGIITAATFKLHPLPARSEWSAWRFGDLACAIQCAHTLSQTQLELSAIELLSGPMLRTTDGCVVSCRAQGEPEAVGRQMAAVRQVCERAGAAPAEPPAAEAAAPHKLLAAQTTCRIAVPPADLGGVLDRSQRSLGERVVAVAASPAIGIARVAFDSAGLAEAVSALREECLARGGSLVIERGPVRLKTALGVWGTGHAGLRIMRALKAEFDPTAALSPGRFVGGI